MLPQATETQTHRWNLYVRGVNGEEITHVVKKACSQAIPLRLPDLNQCIYPLHECVPLLVTLGEERSSACWHLHAP